MKRVIINADDYGRDVHINRAIREAVHNGMVSDVSIMTTCTDGMKDLKVNGGFTAVGYSGGIHLCLTLGRPLTDMRDSFLVEDNGDFKKKYPAGRFLSDNDKKAIREEFCSQIEALQSIEGFQITHLDSHQHICFRPELLTIAVSVCKKYNIPCMRIPSNSANLSLKSRVATWLKIQFIRVHGIKVVDYFGSPAQLLGVSNRNYFTVELMCHPWYSSYGEIMNKVALHEADDCNTLASDLAPFLDTYRLIKYKDFIEENLQ